MIVFYSHAMHVNGRSCVGITNAISNASGVVVHSQRLSWCVGSSPLKILFQIYELQIWKRKSRETIETKMVSTVLSQQQKSAARHSLFVSPSLSFIARCPLPQSSPTAAAATFFLVMNMFFFLFYFGLT